MYINQTVPNRCNKLRMKNLGRAYIRLCSSPSFEQLNFDERMLAMLDFIEENQRVQKTSRLKQQAHLPHPCADVWNFDFQLQPGIQRNQVVYLLSFDWVKKHQHLVIWGAPGENKVKLACGFANHALQHGVVSEHIEFNQLVFELRLAQENNEFDPYQHFWTPC